MNTKDIKTEWDLSALLSSDDEDVSNAYTQVQEKTKEFIATWQNRKDYLEDENVLKEALDDYRELKTFWGTCWHDGFYFWLRSTQDQSDPDIKARLNKALDFEKSITNSLLFFELSLVTIDEKRQKTFLQSDVLKDYKHFLERIFNEAAYTLSEKEEQLLVLTSDTGYNNWVRMNADLISRQERVVQDPSTNKKEQKNFSQLMSLISDSNQSVRDQAADAINDIFRMQVDVAEAELNAVLEHKKVTDQLRAMPRPDLSRHLADDMDSSVVDALVGAVRDRFDVARSYYQLKARLFGKTQLLYHERNVPYGSVDKHYSFQEGVALVHNTFSSLDEEFGNIFEMFATGGHIDAFPRKGKKDGAFCAYNAVQEPTYILSNYNNKLQDVVTLAHESGHGINFELVKQAQHALYFGTPTSTAEVASTFFEDFVLEELLHSADDEERLAIMMSKLNDDVSIIFRQVACYLFELELHRAFREQGYLSKETIGQLLQQHMAAYMGDAVEQSKGSQNWWIHWSHIRRYFYVYSYASGLLISKAMQDMVVGDSAFMDKVKTFLSAGLSDSPKNIFGAMGITISDSTFWHKGIDKVEHMLATTTQLAKKLGKI